MTQTWVVICLLWEMHIARLLVWAELLCLREAIEKKKERTSWFFNTAMMLNPNDPLCFVEWFVFGFVSCFNHLVIHGWFWTELNCRLQCARFATSEDYPQFLFFTDFPQKSAILADQCINVTCRWLIPTTRRSELAILTELVRPIYCFSLHTNSDIAIKLWTILLVWKSENDCDCGRHMSAMGDTFA